MIVRLTSCAALLLASASAAAHSGTGLAGGFVPGLKHPISGPDHLLAMVAVGLWGGISRTHPCIQALPIVFPMMMVGGAVLAMCGRTHSSYRIGGCPLSVGVGSLHSAALGRSPCGLPWVIVGVFGVFHGYAHGKELPSAADPLGYSLGFVLATGLLHVAGIGLGFCSERPGGTVAIRCAGALITGCGLWFVHEAIRT